MEHSIIRSPSDRLFPELVDVLPLLISLLSLLLLLSLLTPFLVPTLLALAAQNRPFDLGSGLLQNTVSKVRLNHDGAASSYHVLISIPCGDTPDSLSFYAFP